jgi:hypothetical protein
MIWAVQRDAVSPSKADAMIRRLVDEAGKEMGRQGHNLGDDGARARPRVLIGSRSSRARD